jgi:predicted nucleic acid-binding protein
LAIFNGEANGPGIRALLRELRRDKVKIYTSIITVQEVSVLSFRAGKPYDDNHSKVNKLAKIYTISREIALTAAKLEAQAIDLTPKKNQVDNRRRKWDCFHIATAMQLGCRTLYSVDEGMLARKAHLSIGGMEFLEPLPRALELNFGETPPQPGKVQ